MQRTKIFKNSGSVAGIFVLLLITVSCEKTKDELLDPDSAGVWTLYNSSNSGLPGNTIKDLQLDKQGNIWIACYGNGVAMYNKRSFESYSTSNSSILSNMVTSVESTDDGGIIIGTTNGLSLRNADGKWTSFKDPSVTTMNISTLKVTSDGTLWVGTDDIGYYVFLESDYLHSSSGFGVYKVEEDNKGNIWVGYTGGLAKFDGTIWSYIRAADGLPDGGVSALFFDSKERLWIGLLGGEKAYWLDNSGVHPLSLMNGAVGNLILDICEDKRGDIWFATLSDGLIRYDGVIPHSYKEYNGFYENDVNCILKDKDGDMWFGLDNKGLVRYTLPLE